MAIDDLMTDEIMGRKTPVIFEQRDSRSAGEVARERLVTYFANCPTYNTPSVFVRYQLSSEGLGFWDRLRGRSPIMENWLFPDGQGGIRVSSLGNRKLREKTLFEDYLPHAQSVHLTFLFGSHYNGDCVVDWNGGSSRIGRTIRRDQ